MEQNVKTKLSYVEFEGGKGGQVELRGAMESVFTGLTGIVRTCYQMWLENDVGKRAGRDGFIAVMSFTTNTAIKMYENELQEKDENKEKCEELEKLFRESANLKDFVEKASKLV